MHLVLLYFSPYTNTNRNNIRVMKVKTKNIINYHEALLPDDD
jgi:hypothetical protein